MIENGILIYYTKLDKHLRVDSFNQYLSLLPTSLQEKNLKYCRWQDRHLHLFGKILLLIGLKNFGYDDDILNKINYNLYSRPFIDSDIDFNITHSGEYVLCAIGRDLRIGIDVEEIKEINFNDFRQVMTSEQWEDIAQSKDSTNSFFKYWTIKESVIKADSRGLSIPLLDINIQDNFVCYDKLSWYLEELKIDKRYSAFFATNKLNVQFKLKYIDFYRTEEYQISQINQDPEVKIITNNINTN